MKRDEFDNFWEFAKSTKNARISFTSGMFHITYNPDIDRVEFVNNESGQRGQLAREDFKLLWGKQADVLLPYAMGEKLPHFPPNELYIACIIRYYLR